MLGLSLGIMNRRERERLVGELIPCARHLVMRGQYYPAKILMQRNGRLYVQCYVCKSNELIHGDEGMQILADMVANKKKILEAYDVSE